MHGSVSLIILLYEIMQLQTSIRGCKGNHYAVTVINDGAEIACFFPPNNPGAQGLLGLNTVAKETDDIPTGTKGKKNEQSFFAFHSFLSSKELVLAQAAAATQAFRYFRH